jgi:protein O-mannosyl-transferase
MPKNQGFGIRHLAFDIDRRAALGILVCALTALVYQTAFDLPFVFEDRTTVLLNPSLVQPWDFAAILERDVAVKVTYAFDRSLWGFSSFGFHLSNFVLHIIVVGLFYGCCTRALVDGGRHRRSGASAGVEWAAFFAAAVFALHPVVSSTVLYVSARSEIVGAAAFLISLMFGRRAILKGSTSSGVLAAAAGLLAFGASAAGASLPVVLLVYDAWLLRTGDWRRRLWRAYIPGMAVVAAGLAWGLYMGGPISWVLLLHSLITESIVVWRYLGLVLVPWRQAAVHDARSVDSLADPLALLAIAAFAGAIAAAIRLRRLAPLVSVGAIWFFAALAAISTIVPMHALMAEPRVYLASMALLLAVFAGLAPLLASRRAPRSVATAVLAILVVLTSMRIRVWSDPLLLWTEAVERSPGSWLAHFGFSEALKEAGQCDRALKEFAVAGDLNPHLPQPVTGWAPCPRPPR